MASRKNLYKKINVFDIETLTENDTYSPYCICSVVNDVEIWEYIELYNKKDIIISFFESIITKFPNEYKFELYAHNLNFDGSFILKSLSENRIKFECNIKEKNIYFISFISFLSCIG